MYATLLQIWLFDLQWIPEITHYCPGIPFIVVGTDTHLREDAVAVHQLSRQGLKPVTANSAVSLAQELNAVKYMECSVKTYHGLKNVFDEAVLVALTYDRPRKRKTFFEHFRSTFQAGLHDIYCERGGFVTAVYMCIVCGLIKSLSCILETTICLLLQLIAEPAWSCYCNCN